jgi:site-specific recombinase XerD
MRVFRRNKIIEVADAIPSLTPSKYPYKIRDRALFCLLYLTGARIGEIVKRVKKKDFELIKMQDKSFLVVELYTEKNRKHPIRIVPISMDKESALANYVLDYLNGLKSEDVLFNFTIQRSWQIIRHVFKRYKRVYRNKFMNANHFLRHCRLTHLVTVYDFSDQHLVRFAGWSNSIPAVIYSHLRWKDLAKKMM